MCVEQCILNGFAFPYYILGKFPTIIGLFLFISDANCVPLHKISGISAELSSKLDDSAFDLHQQKKENRKTHQ